MGSELFRKVREDGRSHFHLVSSKSDHGRPSYDQKAKQIGQDKNRYEYPRKTDCPGPDCPGPECPGPDCPGPLRVLKGSFKGPLRLVSRSPVVGFGRN